MSNRILKKTNLLFAVIVFSCLSYNAQLGRCNDSVSCCDSLIICRDSLVEKNSTNRLCDSSKVCSDSLNRNPVKHIIRHDTLAYVNTSIDSIINIIAHFRKVECELQDRNPQDITNIKSPKILPRKLNEVLRYILLDEDNYKSNDIVFGLFSSSIRYKLYQSKKKYVFAEFDFGLRKWQILDSKKDILFQGDIKENNLQILRLSRIVFPEDEMLKILQVNLKAL